MVIYVMLELIKLKKGGGKITVKIFLLSLFFGLMCDILAVSILLALVGICLHPDAFFPYHIKPQGWSLIFSIFIFILIRIGLH